MLYTLAGIVALKKDNFFVLEVGGFGIKVFAPLNVLRDLQMGKTTKIFTSFKVKEDAFEIYGFLNEEEMNFFELLNSVNGVGPKTALN
ncbi:MAG: Holliday junction DNA helicase subunit RuvA, partial [Parcubacteria group bacterium Athens0714_26]